MRNDAAPPWLVWTATALAAIGLVLVVWNAWSVSSTQKIQADVSQRQQAINQAATFNNAERALVQDIANVAVNRNNDDLKALLSRHNITIKVNAPANAPAAAGSTGAAPAKPASGGNK